VVYGGKKKKHLFEVSMPNPQDGDDFTLRLRMQCDSDGSKWRSYKMRRVKRATWQHPIAFEDKDRGRCKYYLTATPPDTTQEGSDPGTTQEVSGRISLRSKKNPYTLTVR